MREFYLLRVEDETGVSGTGIVARGVVLPSGKCVLEWVTQYTSVAIYESVAMVEAIHGHGGKTIVVFPDSADEQRAAAETLTGEGG